MKTNEHTEERVLPLLDFEHTALVVVDMQNGFISPEGSVGRAGADTVLMQATVGPVRRLVEAVRGYGILDVWTIQEHYPDDRTRYAHRIIPHTLRRSSGAPALINTWDGEVIPELTDLACDPAEFIRKHRFSAFLDTRFETLLRMKGIDTLIICGVSTSLCVETTVRDAYQRDFDVIVASDAVGISSADMHHASLRVIDRYFGMCVPTDVILARLDDSRDFHYSHAGVGKEAVHG